MKRAAPEGRPEWLCRALLRGWLVARKNRALAIDHDFDRAERLFRRVRFIGIDGLSIGWSFGRDRL